ncbi:MAG: GNAT family N-acetyltransferase [Dehalococcoidia bacterium]
MAIDLRRTTPDDVPELGRICYEAFKDISESHGFASDFPTVEFAQQIVGMLVQQEDVYGVAATDGGTLKASNFINMWGDVAGIGPVSVDITSQGQGIGRMLMEDVVKHAEGQGYEMVRLVQDSFNMQSLALYASLGFDVKEPLAYLALADSTSPDANVRPATANDLDAMDELCKSVYRVSRKGECAAVMALNFPAFVLDRGHVAGYLIGTAIGHGVAENDEDMLALLSSSGSMVPDAHSFVALRQGNLYRKALAAGHRNEKIVNLMAYGPYAEPQGTYCPSVMF